jgi:hypothetical protein
MIISATTLSILVYAALVVTIAAPVILLALFLLDMKREQLW